jgi:hypothetical protein
MHARSKVFAGVSPSKVDGRKCLVAGLEYQRRIADACRNRGWTNEDSLKRGKADLLKSDEQ